MKICPVELGEVCREETSEGRAQADPLARGGRQRANPLARGGRQRADPLARGGQGTRGEPRLAFGSPLLLPLVKGLGPDLPE